MHVANRQGRDLPPLCNSATFEYAQPDRNPTDIGKSCGGIRRKVELMTSEWSGSGRHGSGSSCKQVGHRRAARVQKPLSKSEVTVDNPGFEVGRKEGDDEGTERGETGSRKGALSGQV